MTGIIIPLSLCFFDKLKVYNVVSSVVSETTWYYMFY